MLGSDDILQVKDLKVHFPIKKGLLRKTVGFVRAVDGVSLTISSGETLGLVGESGCGKTTLGRAILRLVDVTDGEILYSRAADSEEDSPVDILQLDERELKGIRSEISAIFQDPYSSLDPRMPVADIVAEPLKIHGWPRAERRRRAADLLEKVGLSPRYANRYPHEFSGGQRQRISIARALALNPRLIICDEPVSALDVSIQAQILNLMADLQQEFGFTYLFISHNLSVVHYISQNIAVMYLGKLVEIAPADALYTQPLHPYSEALLAAIPIADPEHGRSKIRLGGNVPSPIDPPKGCRFHPRCRYQVPQCSSAEPPLSEVESGRWVACHRAKELTLKGLSIDELTDSSVS